MRHYVCAVFCDSVTIITCMHAFTRVSVVLHTGNKVEFNTVDFVALVPYTVATKLKGRSTFGDRVDRIGDKVDRVGDSVDRSKLPNSSCCRFVAKIGDKVETMIAERRVSLQDRTSRNVRRSELMVPGIGEHLTVMCKIWWQQSRPYWQQS